MKGVMDEGQASDAAGTEQKQAAERSDPGLAAILADAGRGRRKRRWWQVAIGLVVLAFLAFVVAPLFFGGGESTSYTTVAATEGDLTVKVTATGSVQPTDQVDVSSELSGRIKSVAVDYNSPVKAGDVLAELVTDNLDAAVKGARAKLAAAKANVAKAHATIASTKGTLDSKTVLVGRNVSSSQELLDAQAAYDAAIAAEQASEADVQAAEADLALAETNLSKAAIRSPIDGVVLARNVDPGATVAASLSAPTLFVIAGDLRRMKLEVDVDEADVGVTKVGQDATFTVDAYPDQRFPARISDIRYASETTNNVVTYKATLSVDNASLMLRPGMTATADITVEEVKGAVLIPNAALRFTPPETTARRGFSLFSPPRMGAITSAEPTGSKRRVYVLRDGAPQPVDITIGATDGVKTVVKDGAIKPGDLLVTDATAKR